MKENGEIKNCKVSTNFGEAREYLMYEMLAYYMQMFLLIIYLCMSQMKDQNIFTEDSVKDTAAERKVFIDMLKAKKIEGLIIFNDKSPPEIKAVKFRLLKRMEQVQFTLDNPDCVDGEDKISISNYNNFLEKDDSKKGGISDRVKSIIANLRKVLKQKILVSKL